jgi:hypothetical protein
MPDADTGSAPPAGRGSDSGLIVVSVLVLALVAVGAGVTWWLDRNDVGRATGPEAAAAFLVAAERSVDATYRLDGEFTRTMADGRQLPSGLLVVQRPPDRLQRSLGSTVGVIGGRTVNCGSSGSEGQYQCAPSGAAEPWDVRRADQLTAFEQYVAGDDPVYDVTETGNGCFELQRRRPEVDTTYGSRAELCFDRPTGALRRLEVAREGGATDVLVGVVVSGAVTDADFDLSADGTYDLQDPAGG